MCHEQKPYYTENTDKFKHYVRLVYTIASKFTINTDYEHLIPDEFIASTMCHNQHGRYFSRSSSAPFVCPGLSDPALWQNALQMILKVSDLLSLDDTVLPAKPPSVKNQLDWGLNCAGEFFALTNCGAWCVISSSSSSFYLNQATWPINVNKRHTDRQIDSISKRKKKSNTRCTVKHSETHKNADGQTHRSSFTSSLLWLLQTHRKVCL